jgi:signal transduction histidine kinase
VADYVSISLINTRLFKALEERLAVLQRSADAVQVDKRIQQNLFHGYHNELKSSLTVIGNNVNLLTNNGPDKLNGEQIKALLVIQDKLGMVEEIVASMVKQYPTEAIKHHGPVNLTDLARQAVNRFQQIALLGQVQIEAEIPKQPIYSLADAIQISQVLDGILSNALKFTQPGGQISMVMQSSSNEAHIKVQDSGAGMAAKFLPSLFDADHPIRETAPAHYGGIGIDLPLIKEILDAHGGKIWAESKPGEGSTFQITLPVISL